MSEPTQDAIEQNRYTLAYRAAEARQVMSWIRAGESGRLVGLRGAGKSNFLRFLSRKEVRQHYLGRGCADYVFVLVDLLALTERTGCAVCELVLARLVARLGSLGIEPDTVKEMESLYQDVTRAMNPLMAQRAIERCMDVLCQRPAQRLVLFFDEFDAVFRALDPSLLRFLRAIRDAHKEQVSYIVVVADELAYPRDSADEAEQFNRLVSRNVCGLGPYGEADARQMIGYLTSRRSIELSEQDTTDLIKLSGGHAGLLKTILSLIENTRRENGPAGIVAALQDEPAVQAECGKVWDSLSESEQAGLCALTSGARANPNALRRLKLKGLVRPGPLDSPLVFSPLFADFCRRQTPFSKERIVVDRPHRIAMIDGQPIELTELEFETLCYLYEHRGQVCTKDELIENVYRQQHERLTGGMDDARLQTLISRLRAKVEPPRSILTIRGEGYKLVGPGET